MITIVMVGYRGENSISLDFSLVENMRIFYFRAWRCNLLEIKMKDRSKFLFRFPDLQSTRIAFTEIATALEQGKSSVSIFQVHSHWKEPG